MAAELFSNVQVFKNKNPKGSLVGNGSVLVAGAVEVRFTIVQGSKGLFVSLPAKKSEKTDENGKAIWYPDVKIPDEDTKKSLEKMVIEAYKALENKTAAPKKETTPDDEYGF